MSELDKLARTLFERTDGRKTVNFKVFLGRDNDAPLESVCAEINKVFAQDRAGCLTASKSVDGHLKTVSLASLSAV